MRRPADHPAEATVRAALHRAADRWRVVIASTAGRRPSLVEAAEVPVADQAALARLMAMHKVGRAIVVVPAGRTICRTCTLPAADGEHLHEALELQVEAMPLSGLPSHRVGAAVAPSAPGETTRTGLVLAWPPATEMPELDVGIEVTYVPEIAAIAAIVGEERPADPVLSVDPASGSVAIALAHAGGVAFRGVRDEFDSSARAPERIAAAIAETALSAGHSAAFAGQLRTATQARVAQAGRDATLLLPPGIAARIADRFVGARNDDDWLRRFGVAAGSVLASCGPLEPLTILRRDVHVEAPSRVQTLLASLARPRIAAAVVVGALVVLGLAPVVGAGVRLAVLSMRYPDVDEQRRAVEAIRTKLAMYDVLERESWSMTKALSDIVTNAPRGIDLEWIRVTNADDGFSITGTVKADGSSSAQEIVAMLERNLVATGIFGQITLKWGDSNKFGIYAFDLAGKFVRPYRRYEYPVENDYGRWPLAARLKGESAPADGTPVATAGAPRSGGGEDAGTAAPSVPPAVAQAPVGDGEESSSRTPRSVRPGIGSQGEGTLNPGDVTDRNAAINPNLIPEPLSEAQISAMTREEVLARLRPYAEAKKAAERGGDEALTTRLQSEWDLLFKRLRELNAG